MKTQLLLAGSFAFFFAPAVLPAGNPRGEHGGFGGGSRGAMGGEHFGGGHQFGGGGEAMHRTPSMSGGSGEMRGSFNRPSGGGMVPRGGAGEGLGRGGFQQGGGNRFASRPTFDRPNEGFQNRFAGGGQGRPGSEGRPNFPSRPGQGGSGERWPGGQASLPGRPGQGGSGERWPGGGAGQFRPGQGGSGERWPGGETNFPSRPGQGGSGERWPGGQANLPSRPGQGGSGERWPGGGQERPTWPGQGGSGERLPKPMLPGHPDWTGQRGIGDRTNVFGNDTNIGNRTNIGNGANINSGNQALNVNNYNANIANNRTWNGGGWNGGGWNGGGWNGAHNYWNGNYGGWHAGNWSNWYQAPAAWGAAGVATGWLASPLDSYAYSNPFYVAPTAVDYGSVPADAGYNYVDYSQSIPQPPQVTYNSTYYAPSYDSSGGYTYSPDASGGYTYAPNSDASASAPASDSGAYGQASDANPPAPTASDAPAASDDSPPPEAFKTFDAARTAFKANNYAKALKEIDRAIKLLPSDVTRHEFRALVLFAQGKYRDAAAGVYAVLSAGPGWTWETVRDLYPNPETYTKQLRALEDYSHKHPEASDAHFLLAYQYLVLNHVPAAVKQLDQFEKLVPQDKLAPQLVAAFTPPAGAKAPGAAPG
jgi:tetratricopeptide (TPR) repeat protein